MKTQYKEETKHRKSTILILEHTVILSEEEARLKRFASIMNFARTYMISNPRSTQYMRLRGGKSDIFLSKLTEIIVMIFVGIN